MGKELKQIFSKDSHRKKKRKKSKDQGWWGGGGETNPVGWWERKLVQPPRQLSEEYKRSYPHWAVHSSSVVSDSL